MLNLVKGVSSSSPLEEPVPHSGSNPIESEISISVELDASLEETEQIFLLLILSLMLLKVCSQLMSKNNRLKFRNNYHQSLHSNPFLAFIFNGGKSGIQ